MKRSCINPASIATAIVGAGGDGWVFPGTSVIYALRCIYLFYLFMYLDPARPPMLRVLQMFNCQWQVVI